MHSGPFWSVTERRRQERNRHVWAFVVPWAVLLFISDDFFNLWGWKIETCLCLIILIQDFDSMKRNSSSSKMFFLVLFFYLIARNGAIKNQPSYHAWRWDYLLDNFEPNRTAECETSEADNILLAGHLRLIKTLLSLCGQKRKCLVIIHLIMWQSISVLRYWHSVVWNWEHKSRCWVSHRELTLQTTGDCLEF